MDVREEEKKTQIRRRRILELRGKLALSSRINIISASSKWIVVVPSERERDTTANYLYVCGISSEEVTHVEGHTHPISAVDFTHQDESKFASASTDGEIRVWKANDAGVLLLSSHHRHKAVVSQLLFHRSKDTLILSSSPNERLLVWDWMTNKISFAVPDDSSISAWSIDSRAIFSACATQLRKRDGLSGGVLSSCEFSPGGGTPYKMLAMSRCLLLVLSEREGTSKLSLHDTDSLLCVHTLSFPDSSCVIPWYNSTLSLLTLVHKSDNSIECFDCFDCSPYLRSHLSRRVIISSQCSSHDWAIVSGEVECESSPLASVHCLPSNPIHNAEEEIISVLHAPSSSPSLYLTTIRHAPLIRTAETEVADTAEEVLEEENNDSSSKNEVSPSLDAPPSQCHSSSTPHSESKNQLTFSRKWDFLSQVTQADYRSKEDEEEDNLGTSTDTNQESNMIEKTTIEEGSRSAIREDGRVTEGITSDSPSIVFLSELKEDSPQSSSRSLSLQSTEISWSENENSLVTQGSNGTANMTTVTMDEGGEEEDEIVNGREGREEGESRASYAYMDRSILEETVLNLETSLRKSEREKFSLQKRLAQMEADIRSFRYECEWKDGRISELERLLSVQSSAQ